MGQVGLRNRIEAIPPPRMAPTDTTNSEDQAPTGTVPPRPRSAWRSRETWPTEQQRRPPVAREGGLRVEPGRMREHPGGLVALAGLVFAVAPPMSAAC